MRDTFDYMSRKDNIGYRIKNGFDMDKEYKPWDPNKISYRDDNIERRLHNLYSRP